MAYKIVARALEKRFDGGLVCALDGLDLQVSEGEYLAIMGPTGCGKSTLLSLLAVLDRPDGGVLWVDGRRTEAIRSPEAWRSSSVGIVFQLHHLLRYLTAEENVMLPLAGSRLSQSERRHKARSSLEEVGLGHRCGTLASKLSGGERQLTAVARALVRQPALVLADEPTGSVDSASGEKILQPPM